MAPTRPSTVLPPLTDHEVNLLSRLLLEAKAEGDPKRAVAAGLWQMFRDTDPQANVYLTLLKVVKPSYN